MMANMKLFAVTESHKGRLVHWYVSWRKQELVDIPATMQEFFTKQEATTFVEFARRKLNIPRLTVAPAPLVVPAKSYENQNIELGIELYCLMVGGEDGDFGVGSFG
jgi:hypothetical protein